MNHFGSVQFPHRFCVICRIRAGGMCRYCNAVLSVNFVYRAAGRLSPGYRVADTDSEHVVSNRMDLLADKNDRAARQCGYRPVQRLRAGDNKDQIAQSPVIHNNQGLYPLKNESINSANGVFRQSRRHTAASAAISMRGTKAQETISGTTSRSVRVRAVRNETVQPRKNTRNNGLFKPSQAFIAHATCCFVWKHFA